MPLKEIIYVSLSWLKFLNDSYPCITSVRCAFPGFSLLLGLLSWYPGGLDKEERALGMDKEDLCLSLSPVIRRTSLRDLFCIMGIIILHLFIS